MPAMIFSITVCPVTGIAVIEWVKALPLAALYCFRF
jgi:hypothetical protein